MSDSTKNSLAICIPVANEEATVLNSLIEMQKEISTLKELNRVQVYLITDDISVDKTQKIIEDFAKSAPQFELVHFKDSDGVVSCYLYGLKKALEEGFDYIIEMDFGGSHPTKHISEIVEQLLTQNYEAVFMSRFLPGGAMENVPLYRLLISKYATTLIRYMFGSKYTDITSGYKGFQQDSLRKVINFDYAKGSVWQVQMKLFCKDMRYIELPYVYVGSTTTFKWRWLVIALKEILKLKFKKLPPT